MWELYAPHMSDKLQFAWSKQKKRCIECVTTEQNKIEAARTPIVPAMSEIICVPEIVDCLTTLVNNIGEKSFAAPEVDSYAPTDIAHTKVGGMPI